MINSLKPTKDRVLIDPIAGETSQVGCVLIPDAYQDKSPTEGLVIGVGPQADMVRVGDRVIFPRHDGERIQSGTKLFRLFRQSELLAIIDQTSE